MLMKELLPAWSMGGGKSTPELPPPVVAPELFAKSFWVPSPPSAAKSALSSTLHAPPMMEVVASREKPRNMREKRLKEAICSARG
jgi:hypothetical protein